MGSGGASQNTGHTEWTRVHMAGRMSCLPIMGRNAAPAGGSILVPPWRQQEDHGRGLEEGGALCTASHLTGTCRSPVLLRGRGFVYEHK